MAGTAADRVLRARIAAHEKWAKHDRVDGTAKARAAFLDRFERQVDPDCVLDPKERRCRAESARKAYFTRLAMKSARARRSQTGSQRDEEPTR